MTAIKPERLDLDKSVPEKPSRKRFAPVRRAPQKLGDVDQVPATLFEGEIREFVRRDVAYLRRQRDDSGSAG